MKRRTIFGTNLILAAALAASPLVMLHVGAPMARAEEKKKKTELSHKMEVMDEGMKKLKRTLKKPDQNEESAKLIDTIIEAAKAARELSPEKTGTLSDADKAKFVEAYQASMDKLIGTMGQMKKAVEAGDNKKAMELHKSLKTQEEDGHDKFMEDDSKESGEKK